MKNFVVRSEYNCLIKHESGESFLDENSQLIFDSPEKLLVYPLSKTNKNSYPFVLDLGGTESSRFFKRFELREFDLFFISSLPYVKNEIIEKVKIDQIEKKILISEDNLCFETENLKKTIPLTKNFDDYYIKTSGNLILLHLISETENLWIYNVKDSSLRHFEGKKIEILDERIIVTRELNDIAHHVLFENYELKDDLVQKVDSGLKHSFESEVSVKNPKVIPIAFLEAVKYEDFELARTYLNENLSSVSNDHFKQYFKEFSKIIPLENNSFGLISHNSLKRFKFTLQNGKISEISEV